MNKQEIAIVIVLSALLFAWFHQQNKYARERLAAAREQAAIAATNAPPTTLSSEAQTTAAFQEGGQPSAAITPVSEVPAAPALPPDEIPTKVPEQTANLVNDQMQLAISSKGGTIRSATLCGYRSTVDRDSPPVELDFTNAPALILKDLPGFGAQADYDLVADATATNVTLTRRHDEHSLTLERRITLLPDYRVSVRDRLINTGTNAYALPPNSLGLGAILD